MAAWSAGETRMGMRVSGAVLLAALVFGTAGIAAEPVLRFGTEGAYAPFNFIGTNGKVQGFDVEIGEALCAAAQRRCQWAVQDWDGLIPALNGKRFDAIIASMAITEKRKAAMDFTAAYYGSPAVMLARKGQGGPLTRAFLSGKTVGVQAETIHEAYLDTEMKDWAAVRRYKGQEDAGLDLMNGRLDLLFGNRVQLDAWVKANGGYSTFSTVGEPFDHPSFGEGAGIAVRKGDTALRETLNKALAQILHDGTYAKINARYFDFDIRK